VCWSSVALVVGASLVLATPLLAQTPTLAPPAEGCCITPKEYFQMRDSLVAQLAASREQYRLLRDSVDNPLKKKRITLNVAVGPGVFYDFKEKQILGGVGLAIGFHVTTWKISF
jgi:hypothetical protein